MVRDGVERLQPTAGRRTASATCCVPLEGGYGLPFRHRRPAAREGPVPRRRRLADRLARLLRGLQDSDQARPRASPSATMRRRRRVVIINEAMAKQFWPDKAIR